MASYNHYHLFRIEVHLSLTSGSKPVSLAFLDGITQKWERSRRWSFQAKGHFNQQVCVSVGWGLVKALTQPARKALQALSGGTNIGFSAPVPLCSAVSSQLHTSLLTNSIISSKQGCCHSAASLAVARIRTGEVFSETRGDPQVNTWRKALGWKRREWRKEKNSSSSRCPREPYLAGTDRTPVFFQGPHLPIALQSSFMGAITRAGRPRGTEAVEAPCQVDTCRIIPTGMSS